MKTFIALTTPNPKEFVFKAHHLQFEFVQKKSKISFFTHAIPVGADKVFYGSAWGGNLFTALAYGMLQNPESAELIAPLWPLTVQYLRNFLAKDRSEGCLMFFQKSFDPDFPGPVWVLGYEVSDVSAEELANVTFSLPHVKKVSQMSMGLLLELTNETKVRQFAREHDLLEQSPPSPLVSMFGKAQVRNAFGITSADLGEDEGDNFARLGLWEV